MQSEKQLLHNLAHAQDMSDLPFCNRLLLKLLQELLLKLLLESFI